MTEPTEHPDWLLITGLGGPVKVAELLNFPKEGGVQRVQNWKVRGIPSAVKLSRPDLFLKRGWDGKERRKTARTPSPTEPTTI